MYTFIHNAYHQSIYLYHDIFYYAYYTISICHLYCMYIIYHLRFNEFLIVVIVQDTLKNAYSAYMCIYNDMCIICTIIYIIFIV